MLLPYTTHTPTLSPYGFFLCPVLVAETDRDFFFWTGKLCLSGLFF